MQMVDAKKRKKRWVEDDEDSGLFKDKWKGAYGVARKERNDGDDHTMSKEGRRSEADGAWQEEEMKWWGCCWLRGDEDDSDGHGDRNKHKEMKWAGVDGDGDGDTERE